MMTRIQHFNFAKKGAKGDKKADKKQAEKTSIKAEFEGSSVDDVKQTFIDDLEVSVPPQADHLFSLVFKTAFENLEEELGKIKLGRASPTIFNDLEVKAYGEEYPFGDLATV
jgi:hypothetical protein